MTPAANSADAAQADKARRFLGMHGGPGLLLLANAWDAGSAVVFERAGFQAIGTSSAGVAYSLGLPDGQRVSLQDLLAVLARIVRRVGVPLSVDLEAGYAADTEGVLAAVDAVIAAGAVGINLEDGVIRGPGGPPELADMEAHGDLLRAIAGLKAATRVPFVINARTDAYWLGIGTPDDQLASAISRGNAYLAAGADCVFVPGNLGRETIRVLVRELQGPLNVIAAPRTPAPRELEDLGVARLSLGSAPARAAYGLLRRLAAEARQGSLEGLTTTDFSYDEANRFFA